MEKFSQAIHHHSKKNKKDDEKETKLKKFLDKIIYFVGIAGPVMTLPQVLQIFILKDASGVSIISWCFYFIFSTIWLMYGIVNKQKPIIITYSFWVVFDFLVFLGSILY